MKQTTDVGITLSIFDEKKIMKVAMIGCGKLGYPCAMKMWEAGHDVIGVDPWMSQADTEFPIYHSITDRLQDRDIIFIAVPTPHEKAYGGEKPTTHLPPKDFDYSIVEDVLTQLSSICTEKQLVVLISTVLPSTNRKLLRCADLPFRYIYNPYLIAMGSVEWDMVNPEMVIIGTSDGDETTDAKVLVDFYKTMMQNNPRYVIGTWEEAESIKIFYNTWISTKIALSNMIQDVAMRIGNMNVDVVTKALADSTMRIAGPAYMKAGMGDGGACHPRDGIALSYLANTLNLGYDMFKSLNETREQQAKNVAKFLVRESRGFETPRPIYIHGRAYKPHVRYTDGSYSELIGHYVEELTGRPPIYVDPLTDDHVDVIDGVVLMAHHAPTTYSHARVIGSSSQKFYAPIVAGSTVVDIWRYLTVDDVPDCTLIHYGNTR